MRERLTGTRPSLRSQHLWQRVRELAAGMSMMRADGDESHRGDFRLDTVERPLERLEIAQVTTDREQQWGVGALRRGR